LAGLFFLAGGSAGVGRVTGRDGGMQAALPSAQAAMGKRSRSASRAGRRERGPLLRLASWLP